MRVACPSCQTHYNIDDARIPSGGAKLKCAKCQTTFPLKLEGGDRGEAVPLPGTAAPSSGGEAVPLPSARRPAQQAIPLPGSGFPALTPAVPTSTARWDTEETRVVPEAHALGIPGLNDGQADPAPSPVSDLFGSFDATDPGGADPLPEDLFAPPPPAAGPGDYDGGAVPLPGEGLFAPPPPPTSFDDDAGGAVPLPGEGLFAPPPPTAGFDDPSGGSSLAGDSLFDDTPSEGAIPLPGEGLFNDDAGGAVPLPGEGLFAPPPPAPSLSADDLGFDSDSGSVALPGKGLFAPPPAPDAAAEPGWEEVEPLGEEPSLDSFPPAPPQDAKQFDSSSFEDVEWDDGATRVASLALPGEAFPPPLEGEPPTAIRSGPLPVGAFRSFPPAPAAPTPRFENLPSPASEESSVEFAEADLLPTPAFQDLPSPAADDTKSPLEDFDPLPTPAAQAPPNVAEDFGGVDFAEPNATPSDPLEFDPTGSGEPVDALEVDLSRPLPPPRPQGTADGLEMLDFIDTAAQAAGQGGQAPKGRRFHVRRRNGKLFGPFDDATILQMLEEGQLAGNEDVSTDADAWTAMGTVPAFSAAIQRLLSTPRAQGNRAQAAPPVLDGLKQKYETRMAARTGARVDRATPLELLQERLPTVAAAAVAALLVLVGLGLGFSRYGVFGHNKLFPATLRPGSPEARELDKARAGLLADNFVSYKEARDVSARLLNRREYPEARAVWGQAIFYLQRRYAAATPVELSLASSSLEDVTLLGDKHPEVIKALANQALTQKKPDQAMAVLQPVVGRSGTPDPELLFLMAEAENQKGQIKSAQDALKRALGRKADAKAHHALGDLQQQLKDPDAAAQEYQEALDADPLHAQSAVELAAVELLLRKHPAEGLAALDKALDEKNQPQLGPAQKARAHALRGYALNLEFKPKEALAELEQALKLDATAPFTRLTLAKTLLAQHEYEKALPLLKEISESEPNNFDATEGYLTGLVSLGRMNDALSVLNQATKRFPGNARLALMLGQVNDALDKGREAEQAYLRALNGDAKLYEANLALARFYLRFHRTDDAKGQLEAAVAEAPKDAAVHAALGELALQTADFDKALAEFTLTTQLDPNLPDGLLGLSKVALERHDFATAKTQAEAALALDGHAKGGHLLLGTILWREADLKGAVTELEKAKAEEPQSVPVATQLAAVKLDQGALDDAENGLMAVLTNNATDPDALYFLARVKNRRSEHTQAIDAMRNALERGANRPSFQYQMGVILRDAGKSSEALEAWKKAVKLDPKLADAWEAMGQVYLERAKPDDAVAAFNEGLKADPQRARLRSAVGDAFFQAGKWDQAISNYQVALKQDSKLTATYFKIGRAYTEVNRQTDAIAWYQRAIQVDANNALPYYYLGYAFKERSRKRDAVAAFKAYLARKPNAEDKKDIEDEIYDLEQTR